MTRLDWFAVALCLPFMTMTATVIVRLTLANSADAQPAHRQLNAAVHVVVGGVRIDAARLLAAAGVAEAYEGSAARTPPSAGGVGSAQTVAALVEAVRT